MDYFVNVYSFVGMQKLIDLSVVVVPRASVRDGLGWTREEIGGEERRNCTLGPPQWLLF